MNTQQCSKTSPHAAHTWSELPSGWDSPKHQCSGIAASIERNATPELSNDRYSLEGDAMTVHNMVRAYQEGRLEDILATCRDIENVALAKIIDACHMVVKVGCRVLSEERYSQPVPPAPPVTESVTEAAQTKLIRGASGVCRHCGNSIRVRTVVAGRIGTLGWTHDDDAFSSLCGQAEPR